MIAHCAATFDGPAASADPARAALAEMLVLRSQIQTELVTARQQAQPLLLRRLQRLAAERIERLAGWLAELEAEIAKHIDDVPVLARQAQLLRSVPGVGPATGARRKAAAGGRGPGGSRRRAAAADRARSPAPAVGARRRAGTEARRRPAVVNVAATAPATRTPRPLAPANTRANP
jgi:transposase